MAGQGIVIEDLPEALVSLVGPYLARQRWYRGEGAPARVAIVSSGCLGEVEQATGRLLWAVANVGGSDYQLLMAERPDPEGAECVRGHEEALIGSAGGQTYYDATVDPDMALLFLSVASGGSESAQRARPLGGEQSNTSLVYDERVILKVFRRLPAQANPDVEVTSALAAAGFRHVARPLVRWQRDGRDLAFGQEYLPGGTDGWALALTSLRDYYGAAGTAAGAEDSTHPGLSGGDFAAEAARLGQMTAEMHLAMAEAYPVTEDLADRWPALVSSLEEQVRQLAPDLSGPGSPLLERLRSVRSPGPALRVHGDYHLGQVMRTDSGWYVVDFEGEPNRPVEERLKPTSAMKDVAGMFRSLDYAARFALRERAEGEPEVLWPLADAWRQRNASAFLRGYYETKGIEQLLPAAAGDREAVRLAFELEKALYEVGYERDYRPQWAAIPEAALVRLLTEPVDVLLAELLAAKEPEVDGDEAST